MQKYNPYLDINYKDRTSEIEALYEPTLKDIKADPEMYAELVNDLLFHWVYGTRETPLMVMVKKQMVGDTKMAEGGVMAKGGMFPSKLSKNDKVELNIKGKEVEVFDIKEYISKNFYYEPIFYPNSLNEYNFREIEFEDVEKITDFIKKEYPNVKFSVSYKGKDYADGGMMAKGGGVEKNWVINFHQNQSSGTSHTTIRVKATNESDAINKGFMELTNMGEDSDEYYVENIYTTKYDDGGMMAKGGLTEHGLKIGDEIYDISKNDRNSIYVMNNLLETNKTIYALVDLDNGERIEGIYADGGVMAKGGVPRQRKYDNGGMMAKGGYDDFGYHKVNKEVTLKNGEKIYITKGRYYWSNELGDGRVSGIYYESKDGMISKDSIDKMALGGGVDGFKKGDKVVLKFDIEYRKGNEVVFEVVGFDNDKLILEQPNRGVNSRKVQMRSYVNPNDVVLKSKMGMGGVTYDDKEKSLIQSRTAKIWDEKYKGSDQEYYSDFDRTWKECEEQAIKELKKEKKLMALGGLFDSPQKRSANRGRSWTLDHRQHNKGQSYETPIKNRKRKY
jgi:hypothetical protein